MSKGTWEDFIGQYSVRDILECLDHKESGLYGMPLGQAIECIVGSVYKDSNFWQRDAAYREFLRTAYPSRDAAIRMIKQEVMFELGLE